MGQYFTACNLTKKQKINSYDFYNGAKITSHCYIGNKFTNQIILRLMPGGEWYGNRIAWVGDYAEETIDTNNTLLTDAIKEYEELKGINDTLNNNSNYYIYNLTKNEYVDVSKCRRNDFGLKVNPLPLLTMTKYIDSAYMNLTKAQKRLLHSWYGDQIAADFNKQNGFTEIIPDFCNI